MTTYLIMLAGFCLLLAMTYNRLKAAPPAVFICRAIAVATVWFTLCLVVLG